MDVEYLYGVRATSLPHEQSPLEQAIVRFEEKARAFHSKSNVSAPETNEQRLAREKELKSALLHLKHERKRIKTLAVIQHRLQEYQNWGRKMADEDPVSLLDEPHHPTKVLAMHMRADGRPQPSNRHSPHHIVEGKGKNPQTADTRLTLHMYGVRINDPDNGVWLPRHKSDKGHWTMPNAPAHSEIHTFNYESWINRSLGPLDNEMAMRGALLQIRCLLRDGKQPAKVTTKKDVKWNPEPVTF